MYYKITYYDRSAFKLSKEERQKELTIYDGNTLSEAILLLQKNTHYIISVELNTNH